MDKNHSLVIQCAELGQHFPEKNAKVEAIFSPLPLKKYF